MQKITIFLSVLSIIAGVIFLIIENIFYQYLDKSGILHESFFLPLGVACIIAGVFLMIVYLIQKLFTKKL